MTNVTATGQLGAWDHVHAGIIATIRPRATWWTLATIASAFAVGAAFVLPAWDAARVAVGATLLVVAVALPASAGLQSVIQWLATRSTGAMDLSFTSTGLRVEHATGAASVAWARVTQVVETREHFVLLTRKHAAVVIPKRWFPDAAAVAEARSVVRAHAKGRGVAATSPTLLRE